MSQNLDDLAPEGPQLPSSQSSFSFVRNGDRNADQLDWDKGPDQVRKALAEALGAHNIAFLLGAGCSSMVVEGTERGISTMAPLAKEFCDASTSSDGLGTTPPWVFDASDHSCLAGHGLALSGDYTRNLAPASGARFAQYLRPASQKLVSGLSDITAAQHQQMLNRARANADVEARRTAKTEADMHTLKTQLEAAARATNVAQAHWENTTMHLTTQVEALPIQIHAKHRQLELLMQAAARNSVASPLL